MVGAPTTSRGTLTGSAVHTVSSASSRSGFVCDAAQDLFCGPFSGLQRAIHPCDAGDGVLAGEVGPTGGPSGGVEDPRHLARLGESDPTSGDRVLAPALHVAGHH